MARIHDIRADLLLLRRAVWPHREAVNDLVRDDYPLIDDETRVYLRDCYDHTVQLIDLVETYREICSDLLDRLPVERQQPDERGDEGPDDHRHDLHPAGLHRRPLRDELRYAASPWNMPELRSRSDILCGGRHVAGGRGNAVVFLA